MEIIRNCYSNTKLVLKEKRENVCFAIHIEFFSFSRTYRGRAYFKRQFYKQATQDLSVAIHLDPNNWLALYYRACLFRKSSPFRALQDYSVSGTLPSTPHT